MADFGVENSGLERWLSNTDVTTGVMVAAYKSETGENRFDSCL